MLELYHHGSSTCASKVRFVLGEKQIPYQSHYVDLLKGEQFRPQYLALNPKAVVPTMVHDGEVLVESTVICEYIDDEFPDPPLAPRSRRTRADAAVDQGGRRTSSSPPPNTLPMPPVIATSSIGCRRTNSES